MQNPSHFSPSDSPSTSASSSPVTDHSNGTSPYAYLSPLASGYASCTQGTPNSIGTFPSPESFPAGLLFSSTAPLPLLSRGATLRPLHQTDDDDSEDESNHQSPESEWDNTPDADWEDAIEDPDVYTPPQQRTVQTAGANTSVSSSITAQQNMRVSAFTSLRAGSSSSSLSSHHAHASRIAEAMPLPFVSGLAGAVQPQPPAVLNAAHAASPHALSALNIGAGLTGAPTTTSHPATPTPVLPHAVEAADRAWPAARQIVPLPLALAGVARPPQNVPDHRPAALAAHMVTHGVLGFSSSVLNPIRIGNVQPRRHLFETDLDSANDSEQTGRRPATPPSLLFG